MSTSLGKLRMDNTNGLWALDIDDAARGLLDLMLSLEARYRAKSFFFCGWDGDGIGASAVLRATAQLLKSRRCDPQMREHFGRVIHVDCSLWKNRRAMQRAIVEELNLGHLMHMFDKQDEDDDFRGMDVSSRVEIQSVGSEIYASLRNERFLMILHYGGKEDIDLAECGIPTPEFGTYASGKLLWSSYGRFQILERKGRLLSDSSYFRIIHLYHKFTASDNTNEVLCHFLHKEAAEVIGYTGIDDVSPAIVLECFLYSLFLAEQLVGKPISVDFGWDTHACNYWICDGILKGDKAFEIGSALHGVINMLCYPSDRTKKLADCLDRHKERYECWISISSNQLQAQEISTLPVNASSCFVTSGEDGQLHLPNDMFQLASNLRVLKLCKCSFDFASPPFRYCGNLRFLWLDCCTNTGEEQGGGQCFPNLLVLDIRFTDFVLVVEMIELMTNLREINTKGVSWRTIRHACKKLQNLHVLRVTESRDVITVDTCPSIDMTNLELLDMSANIHMESLPAMSSTGNLKVLVLDGCSSLEHVALEGAPPLLESFSFDGYGTAEKWTHPIILPKNELRPKYRTAFVQESKVRRICLKGCARLHNIFLRALPNLEELDLSGTAIETLDLDATVATELKKLFLLGCEHLRSLLWRKGYTSLRVLHVDTRRKTTLVIDHGEQRSEALVAFTDGRFLRSVIEGLIHIRSSKVHLYMSSMIHNQVNTTKRIEEIRPSQEDLVATWPFLPYSDMVHNKDTITHSSLMWDHQQLYPLRVHIEIGEGSHHLESMYVNQNLKDFIGYFVQSLHVDDNILITDIPTHVSSWSSLEWCHVERCPKIHTLFSSWNDTGFRSISIFVASDLPMAYCIWGRDRAYSNQNFQSLQHIYLHNCPRLVFVLPIPFTLPNLETIQIAYCGNLQHIFPVVHSGYSLNIASDVTFEKLKHIKLYHLHKLEQICEARLSTPVLETISLRDCWALRRLPVGPWQGPKPVVHCEKDWWDRLEWDTYATNHNPSLFEARHSAYYKKTLPRVSVLR